jgi:hypothetical protein
LLPALLLASSMFLRTFLHERRRDGALAYFSPSIAFFAMYVVCFVLRPIALNLGGLVGYDDDSAALASFKEVLLLSLVGVIAFYVAFDRPWRPSFEIRLLPRMSSGRDSEVPEAMRTASVLIAASALLTTVFWVQIASLGAVTSDIGVNRAVYTVGMSGRGDMFLVNTSAAVSLLMGLYLSSYRRSPYRSQSLLAIVWYLAPNVVVTNRFLITAVVVGVVICWILHKRSIGQPASGRGLLLLFLVVALLGSALGMVRGLGEYAFDDVNASNPIVFFLWTFDMAELFARAVESTRSFNWGWIWVEDLLYLYVPRAIWTGKPQIYGAIAAQAQVLPELIPADGIPTATYPIGVFGEGYYVMGVAGVALALALTGSVLRRLTRSFTTLRHTDPMAGAVLFPVFVLQCLNPLGYFRSFGWFVSLVVFHTAVSLIIFGCARILSRPIHVPHPAAA